MKVLICLLITLGVASGALLPFKPACANVFCTMDIKMCPDGTRAPIPVGGCCPSVKACKNVVSPIQPNFDCAFTMCTMVFLTCPDGTPAPVAPGQCCPSLSACKSTVAQSRSNPLSSLLAGNNLLQTLTSATHGTNFGTVLSVLNLLNNIQQLTNDVHQIPLMINQTIANLINGTGQATQIVIDQLIGAVTGANHQNAVSRGLLDTLGHNANILSSITHLLPQGTSITTVLSILNLLNHVNQLSNDIHQIPALLNQTLTSIVNGTGQASALVLQQLLSLVGAHPAASRGLLDALGHNANILSSITHLLPQGTSITTVLSILNLLNNVNQLSNDIHHIPALLNQTLTSIVNGTGQATALVLQQLLSLVGIQSRSASRNLLSTLGQNANLLSTVSHLLPQGTSISTVLSLLNLLNNVNALNNDLHQIPVVLQQTLQNLLSGIQNILPGQGSS